MSLAEFVSREPLELPEGEEILLRFRAAELRDMETGANTLVNGPASLERFGTIEMMITNRVTGLKQMVAGVRFITSHINGVEQQMPLNSVSKRLIGLLKPFIESGDLFKSEFGITAIGMAPRRKFTLRVVPQES